MIIQTNNKYHEIKDEQARREREKAEKQARIAAAEAAAQKIFMRRFETESAVKKTLDSDDLRAFYGAEIFFERLITTGALDTIAKKIAAALAAAITNAPKTEAVKMIDSILARKRESLAKNPNLDFGAKTQIEKDIAFFEAEKARLESAAARVARIANI